MKSLRSTFIIIITAGFLAAFLRNPQLLFVSKLISPYFTLFGTLFLNGLMMAVFPLVLTSIILGMSKIGQDEYGKSLAYKVGTTFFINSICAVLIGWISFNCFSPFMNFPAANTAIQADIKETLVITDIFMKIFPRNVFKALAEGDMIGLIVFCMLFGAILGSQSQTTSQSLSSGIQTVFDTALGMTRLIMKALPIGIFCLIFDASSHIDMSTFHSLGLFFLMILFGLFLYMVLWLIVLKVMFKISPQLYLKRSESALITAFTTSSSAVTLPTILDTLESTWNIDSRLARFMLPLGITINMSGTALFVCAASLYLARYQGLSMTFGMQLSIVFTTWLTSFGIAGVPSGCLIALTMVLGLLGLPAGSIGLIVGFDRILDMFRTVCNAYANTACALVVACRDKQALK